MAEPGPDRRREDRRRHPGRAQAPDGRREDRRAQARRQPPGSDRAPAHRYADRSRVLQARGDPAVRVEAVVGGVRVDLRDQKPALAGFFAFGPLLCTDCYGFADPHRIAINPFGICFVTG